MKLTLSALTFFGLSVALFQDLPGQAQTQASSTFEVVATPNDNPNSELFAASASSSNDIWAVGQSTIHFDGTAWTAFSAPMIKGDNSSFLQGVVAISPTLDWAARNVTDGAHPGQVIERWNGTKWNPFSGPKFGKKDREVGGDVSSNVQTELSRNDWHHDFVHDLSSQPPQCDPTIDDPVNDTGLGHRHGDLQRVSLLPS